MTALLALALLAPAAAAAGAAGTPSGDVARRAVQAGCALAAVAWTALVALDDPGPLGRFEARPLGAVTACGVALVAAAVRRPEARVPAAVGAAAAALLAAGASAGLGTSSALPLAVAVGAAVLVLVRSARRRGDGGLLPAAAGAVGAALLAVGLERAHDSTGSWRLAAGPDLSSVAAGILVAAAVALAVAGGLRAHREAAPLLPVGLAVGIASGPALATDAAAEAGVAVVLGLLAAGAAWRERPPLALGLVALAAAAGPGDGGPAALLLAAAAVLAAAIRRPAALLAALPGAAALASVLVAEGGPAAAAGSAACLAGLALVARLPTGSGPPVRPPATALPAAALAVWLVLAPRSWAWAGAGPFVAGYQEGVALAVAGALLAVTAAVASSRLSPPAWPHDVALEPVGAHDPPGARAATTAALAGLALALAVLLLAAVGAG